MDAAEAAGVGSGGGISRRQISKARAMSSSAFSSSVTLGEVDLGGAAGGAPGPKNMSCCFCRGSDDCGADAGVVPAVAFFRPLQSVRWLPIAVPYRHTAYLPVDRSSSCAARSSLLKNHHFLITCSDLIVIVLTKPRAHQSLCNFFLGRVCLHNRSIFSLSHLDL